MYERECARIEGHVANGIVPHDHGDAATHRVTGGASSCTTKSIEWGDVCTRGSGDNPQCVVVGHPLEFWYRIGGTFCIGDDAALLTDDDGSFLCNDTAIADPQPLPWASSDIVARVNSRKGIDPLVFSDSSSFSVDLVGMMGVVARRAAHPATHVAPSTVRWTCKTSGVLRTPFCRSHGRPARPSAASAALTAAICACGTWRRPTWTPSDRSEVLAMRACEWCASPSSCEEPQRLAAVKTSDGLFVS